MKYKTNMWKDWGERKKRRRREHEMIEKKVMEGNSSQN